MLVEVDNQSWLSVDSHFLPEVVLVEQCVLPSQEVAAVFVIVLFKVLQQARSHVGVVFSWSDCWEHHGASLLVALSGHQPAGQNDSEEVETDQDPALLAALDLE